jgi:hypothetical protein
MANIKLHDLTSVGSEFFQDSESFLNELTNDELFGVQGGLISITLPATPTLTITITFTASILV